MMTISYCSHHKQMRAVNDWPSLKPVTKEANVHKTQYEIKYRRLYIAEYSNVSSWELGSLKESNIR